MAGSSATGARSARRVEQPACGAPAGSAGRVAPGCRSNRRAGDRRRRAGRCRTSRPQAGGPRRATEPLVERRPRSAVRRPDVRLHDGPEPPIRSASPPARRPADRRRASSAARSPAGSWRARCGPRPPPASLPRAPAAGAPRRPGTAAIPRRPSRRPPSALASSHPSSVSTSERRGRDTDIARRRCRRLIGLPPAREQLDDLR